MFLKEDGKISGRYQYGMIENVEKGRDSKIRSVTLIEISQSQ